MSSSEFYNQAEEMITQTVDRIKWLEGEIANTYQRWQDIEHLLEEQ
jgi:hypothetical protein